MDINEYSAPKFAKRPAAGDKGYALVRKAIGKKVKSPFKSIKATAGPKQKKRGTEEVKEEFNLHRFDSFVNE